jgi:predicted metal-dependent enzyme (double-stranded beta helix superfamily)
MSRYVAMTDLVNDIKSFAARDFPQEEVFAYLSETLVAPDSLENYLSYCEDRYTRHLVHKDKAFELLVICWGSGQGAPIHGHEGELCWARVERGQLRFSDYKLVSEEPLRLERVDEPVDGTAGFLDGPAEIHAVENPVEFGANAASLHLYSKPYSECDIYDSVSGPRRRVSLAYDSVHSESSEGSAT